MAPGTDARTIATPAGRVRRLRWRGTDAEPPVLLLHSLGQEAATWEAVANALRPTRSAYALDLPGHGRSDLPKAADVASVARLVAPALADVAAEASGPLSLVAHAYAAPVLAQALAGLAAGFGNSITLVCALGVVPPAAGLWPELPWAQAVAARALAHRPERVRAAAKSLFVRPERASDATWTGLSASLGRADALWRFGPALLAGVSPLLPALAALGRAARFVWCSADPVFAAGACEARVAAAAQTGPAHRQARLEGVGHLPMLEAPAALAALLRESAF